MLEKITDVLYEKGGGLIIVLIGIFLAIAGSYRFIMLSVDEHDVDIKELKTFYHELDKRVTLLERP